MNLPTRDELNELLKTERISKRLMRDLRYVPEEINHTDKRDFLVVATKSDNEGVLLYEGSLHQFELRKRGSNAAGRVEAIICDICATWQRGTASAVITFKKSDRHTVSHLVCADLNCSLHVRDLTDASKISRTQLREQISPDDRVIRLNKRLGELL